MKNAGLAALVGIAAMLATLPAAFASEAAPRAAAQDTPRFASATPSPAPEPARRPPARNLPVLIGDAAGTPVERMADSIAEYYASGRLRIY